MIAKWLHLHFFALFTLTKKQFLRGIVLGPILRSLDRLCNFHRTICWRQFPFQGSLWRLPLHSFSCLLPRSRLIFGIWSFYLRSFLLLFLYYKSKRQCLPTHKDFLQVYLHVYGLFDLSKCSLTLNQGQKF